MNHQPKSHRRLREYLTRNPMLVVHEARTPKDEEAISLVRAVLGPSVVISALKDEDVHDESIPSLFVSTSVCSGLEGIQSFLDYIRQLEQREKSSHELAQHA